MTLVLIGVAALAGCGEDQRRDVYATREDCLADWGNRPQDCTPATDDKHRRHGYFYGPLYVPRGGAWFGSSEGGGSSWSSSSSRTRSSSSSSSGVSRGGFGSSARSSGG